MSQQQIEELKNKLDANLKLIQQYKDEIEKMPLGVYAHNSYGIYDSLPSPTEKPERQMVLESEIKRLESHNKNIEAAIKNPYDKEGPFAWGGRGYSKKSYRKTKKSKTKKNKNTKKNTKSKKNRK